MNKKFSAFDFSILLMVLWLLASPFVMLWLNNKINKISYDPPKPNYIKMIYSEGPIQTSHIEYLSGFQADPDIPMDADLQEFMYWVCLEKKVDPNLVLAIIEHESGFIPSAVSKTQDYGLMQINIINHEWMQREWGITDFIDPYQNIFAGVSLLEMLQERYPDPEKLMLVYAIGEGGAKNLWSSGIYSTQASREIIDLKIKYDRRMPYDLCRK